MRMKKSFWIAMGLLSLGVTSCKDDVSFDQATYDELISKAFPVQNVDPSHQWATVGKATGSITVNGDYGETYKVGLYLGHPEITTSSKQLYFGEVLSGETLNVTFSHPVATDVIYIGIFDKDGRRVYMNAPIVDGHVDAVYGANSNASRRATEAEAPQYAKTLNDYLNPSSELVGNKTVEQVTAAQMQAYDTFTDADIKSSAKVCVIGQTIVDNLFAQGADPIGQVIRFDKIPMRVVGVLKKRGYNSMGMDQDDIILAPYTTVMKRMLAQTYLSGIYASAIKESMTDLAIADITSILRADHKLKADADDDFNIRSQEEMSQMMNSTTSMMTTLLAAVAGIALVVGGIGIMNIMYVSVTERTREIGLRMSVGARGVDILAQFLIESVLISITGGLIGVVMGVGAAVAVKTVVHWPISIEPWTIVLSFTVCTFIGVFFGWYPAKKAANLDPIEAIRYE